MAKTLANLEIGGVDRTLDFIQRGELDQPALEIASIDVGQGTNTLILDIDDVLLAGTDLFSEELNGFDGLLEEGRHQLRIDGSSGTVNVEGSGWVAAGVTTFNDPYLAFYQGKEYAVYNYGTTAQLLIDTDLDREGAVL